MERRIRVTLSLGLLAGLAQVLGATGFGPRFEDLRRTASPVQLYRFLYALPKGGDIHNHAGGSNIPEWMYAVATDPARTGGDTFFTRIRFGNAADAVAPQARFHTVRRATLDRLPPTVREQYVALGSLTADERQAWCNAFRLDARGEGRAEFFEVIWSRLGDLGRNAHVRAELLAWNIRAFSHEGLGYLETQFGLDGLADNDGNALSLDAARVIVEERLARPDVAGTGLVVRFQDSVLRFSPLAEKNLEDAHAWVRANADRWVGINLVGIEERGPGHPARFLETFRRLRRTGPPVALAIHAGEMDGADRHIRDTLLLGATRIGHGINLIKDPDTLLLLQQSGRVLVEINLISNRLLEYVPDTSRHPFPEYLRTGIPVCLNTDDRGMWDSTMTDEYYTAVTTFDLTWDELVSLGRNSLRHAFVQADVKAELLADYARRVAAFEETFGKGTVAEALATADRVRPVAFGYARRTWGFDFPDTGPTP